MGHSVHNILKTEQILEFHYLLKLQVQMLFILNILWALQKKQDIASLVEQPVYSILQVSWF